MPAFAAADCIEEVIVEKGEGGGSGLAGLRGRRLFLLLRADAEFVVGAKAGFESGVGAEVGVAVVRGSVDSGSVGVAAAAPVGGVEAGMVGFLFLLRLRFVVPQ